jgi:hypothetical protein
VTSEILILNREAVALAADSAATLTGEKIFSSANKIFRLRKDLPVGLMIYSRADFLGIPWETVIGLYRKKDNGAVSPNLEDYGNRFIEFLSTIVTPEIETNYIQCQIGSVLGDIYHEIAYTLEYIERSYPLDDEDRRKIVGETIDRHYNLWDLDSIKMPQIDEEEIQYLSDNYSDFIDDTINRTYNDLPTYTDSQEKLKAIAISILTKFPKCFLHPGASGLVIAGFGDAQIYPSFCSHLIVGYLNGKLICIPQQTDGIDQQKLSGIIPFAQQEMVCTFMEGIDPAYLNALTQFHHNMFMGFPKIVYDHVKQRLLEEKIVPDIDPKIEGEILERLHEVGQEEYEAAERYFEQYRYLNHSSRVMGVVSHLPKDELAAMAETLINLTSFKKKVTMDAQTVGGPIDVAIISKKDGFVWIKRKHYFDRELNPHYFEK